MDNGKCDIRVEISCEIDKKLDIDKFKSLAESVCRRFSVVEADLNIAIVDDEMIAVINEQFLGHTGPTDVISFDLSDDDAVRNFEIVINADQAARHAAVRTHDVESELALYITHGLLHNFGFDDHDEADSIKMHEMEDEILRDEGFGAIYESN